MLGCQSQDGVLKLCIDSVLGKFVAWFSRKLAVASSLEPADLSISSRCVTYTASAGSNSQTNRCIILDFRSMDMNCTWPDLPLDLLVAGTVAQVLVQSRKTLLLLGPWRFFVCWWWPSLRRACRFGMIIAIVVRQARHFCSWNCQRTGRMWFQVTCRPQGTGFRPSPSTTTALVSPACPDPSPYINLTQRIGNSMCLGSFSTKCRWSMTNWTFTWAATRARSFLLTNMVPRDGRRMAPVRIVKTLPFLRNSVYCMQRWVSISPWYDDWPALVAT